MLERILDPSFKNKMPGCRLEDPDIDREHILNLDPPNTQQCQLRKAEGGEREG